MVSGFGNPAGCWISEQAPYFLSSIIEKTPIQKKIQNPDLFSIESTTLNPMLQSDSVTYSGVTVLILFLQATKHHWRWSVSNIMTFDRLIYVNGAPSQNWLLFLEIKCEKIKKNFKSNKNRIYLFAYNIIDPSH